MSQQMTDEFYWDEMPDKDFVFIGAEDVYSLFDPEKFGLNPSMIHTACYKGFIIFFKLKNSQIYIDKLYVYCEDGNYPKINGVKSTKKSADGFRIYENINLSVNYSGTIIIGTDFISGYIGRAFTGPHCYNETYELNFDNGKLVDFRETSGTYSGF